MLERLRQIVCGEDGLVQAHRRLDAPLQLCQAREQVVRAVCRRAPRIEGFLDPGDAQRIEAAQHVKVPLGEALVRVQRYDQVGERLAHRLHAKRRSTRRHLQLHARVPVIHAALNGGQRVRHRAHGHGGPCQRRCGTTIFGRLPADEPPQRLADDLAVQVPQRRLDGPARHGQRVGARARRQQAVGLGGVQEHGVQHQGDELLLQDSQVLVERFGQIPVGGESRALAKTRAAGMVHHFHQQRFAERQRPLRRGEGLAERQADAVQVHALDLDALLVELAQRRAVHLADTRARERIEHEQVLGLVHARQLGRNAARRLLGEYAVGNGAAALPREARGDGGGQRPGQVERRIALDEADRAAAPFLVGRAEDIGVGHTGHAQQLLADLGRVDVLPARDEHIVGAFLHVQLAVGRDGRRVAGQEEPVGRIGGACVQVAGEQPGAAHGKAAEPVGAGVHDAGLVAGKQLHAARETGQHQGVRDVAGRLGHAVAGVHAGACGQGASERLRVQRAPAQQDAHVAAQLVGVRRRQHVLQHLVDHRDVGGAAAGGVGQHAAGVEALVEDERVRVQEAAHHHLQAAHVIQGQRRLPQPLAATIERGVRNRR